jgi:tetratricopeptide (TPR) repeat protein
MSPRLLTHRPSHLARLLISATLLVSCSSNSPQTAKTPPPPSKPEEGLDREAQAILDGYDAAILSDPNNGQLRVARCSFLGELSETAKAQRERLRGLALSDCEHVLSTARDPRLIAYAHDVARVIEGRQVFREKKTICPEDARKAEQEAYYLVRANKLKESLPHFERAVARCPGNASFQIRYGHAFMLLRDFERAKKFLSEGLKRDPWDRSGHLFLSDVYRQSGDLELAYLHASLAVLSDPSYEFGWEQLKELASGRGRELLRPTNRRGVVRLDGKGNPEVVLPLGTDPNSSEAQFWLGLGLVEVTELKERAKEAAAKQANQSPLGRDRARVKENLVFQRHLIEKDPSKRSKIMDVVEEAVQKGYLDEAIFLCLIDARLAREFIAYREKHRERLLEYIASILAPLSSERL